ADLLRDVTVTAGAGRLAHRPRPLAGAAALREPLRDLPARDVGVDLIPEQQHRVRPLIVRGAGHLVRQGHQGVGTDRAQGLGRLVLPTAARPERQADRGVRARRPDHAGPIRVEWPDRLAVELTWYRVSAPGFGS